jgi:hypothetical protein
LGFYAFKVFSFKYTGRDGLPESAIKPETGKTNLFFDFETTQDAYYFEGIKKTSAHSGQRACEMTNGEEYGPFVKKKISSISAVIPTRISASVWVYPLSDQPNTVLTASVTNTNNETVFWQGKSTENASFPLSKWTKINAVFNLPVGKFGLDDMVGIGIWNKGKTPVIIDDLEIVYGESQERRGEPSTVDANAIYEKRFNAVLNKAPFPTVYFQKKEINNGNGTSITPDKTNDVFPEDKIFSGNFIQNSDKLDAVLCIKKASRALFLYSPIERQFKKIWSSSSQNDSLWDAENDYFSGDYNKDGKTDVLAVSKKNNAWKILNFTGNSWNIISSGRKDQKQWTTEKKFLSNDVLNSEDIVFPGLYDGRNELFLKLNTNWRFDLKLLRQEKGNGIIIGNIDFKGYPEDFNPKYFEFVKIVPGKFLSKDQTAILITMCNCSDTDFDGRHCNKIENLQSLPNSVQIYTLSENSAMEVLNTKN